MVYGKPLVTWVVEALKSAEIRTVVSTDCDKIAKVALFNGAEVVMRPEEISGDLARSEDAVRHAIDTLGWHGAYTLMVQCTTPLVRGRDIMGVVGNLLNGDDCAFTVTDFHGFVWDQEVNPIGHDPAYRQRRQDIAPRFIENGAVYGFRTEGFRETGNRFFGKPGMFVMPPERSIEVDEAWQLYLLDTIVKKKIHVNADNRRDEGKRYDG